MPFDGGFLHKISQEINALAGARIDKISHPGREHRALRFPLYTAVTSIGSWIGARTVPCIEPALTRGPAPILYLFRLFCKSLREPS